MAQEWTSVRVKRETMDWLIREAGRRSANTGKPNSSADVVEQAIEQYRQRAEAMSIKWPPVDAEEADNA